MFNKVVFLIGVILFAINIGGIFIPLRNEQIYIEKGTAFEDDIVLTEDELWKEIDTDTSDISSYVTHLNFSVNRGVAHYWRDEGVDKYRLRIPIYENYFLYAASWIYPSVFQKYEFSHYKKAIERGVGLCSEHAIIISEILKEKGIDSKIIGLDGHVVAMALINKSDDQWWILDADYGVVIPHGIDEIEHNPSMIEPYYAQAGYDSVLINVLVDIYQAKGNKVVNGVREYDWRLRSYSLRYYLESVTYFLKWMLPLLMLFPWILGKNR